MKQFISLVIVIVLCVGLCACGKTGPSGKYYMEDKDGVYFEFDGKDTAYLTDGHSDMSSEYLYVVNELEESEDVEGVSVVHISSVDDGTSYRLIYDVNKDSVYCFELDSFFYKE